MHVPPYYSALAPFRGVFRTGAPILTYHHVGPRRRGARLKGLYVSPNLFARQVAELKSAGFSTASFETLAVGNAQQDSRIFLTVDDGFRDVFENALPALAKHRFQAILFLVSDLLGKTNEWQQRAGDITEPLMDAAQVKDWVAAGQQIGAHTKTHPRLTQIPLSEAREEISASKKFLEDCFGLAVNHFCYPYGDWNEPIRDLVSATGYQTACTTISGVNVPGTSPFELKRFTARYPSRNLKALWTRLRARFL
jgi:peptidoglycan/xylan/chitin deacetylase (PgdA/CDA1 family)